jgi:L-2-hydroxyglutarate oxidase
MQYDVAIIGAGIVGLAAAYQLTEKQPGLRIAIIDKEEGIARHQTDNNSGVIHSGIYYKPGGSKALNCARGYRYLLDFAKAHDIPHDLCGKVIVAIQPEEIPRLEKILTTGQENGLKGIRMISREECREIEPHVDALQAIWVPQSGIISYRAVAEKYLELIQNKGGEAILGQAVKDIDLRPGQATVITKKRSIHCRLVINSTGLYSDKIARLTMPEVDLQIIPFRGEYYELKPEKQHLVNNLIYPVPNPNFPFLGVHFTRMIDGGIEAGPNAVLAFQREGYSRYDINWAELIETLSYSGFQRIALKYWRDGLNELYRSYSKSAFVRALQHLIPEITAADLVRGGAGVRAMACGPKGELIDDFLFLEKPGVINVCNAPSPAATASLAIGEVIAEKALKQLTH